MNSKIINKSGYRYWLTSVACFCFLALISQHAAAAGTIGDMASTIANSFTNLAKLITAGSYLAGLGFSIGAIMKFKQHKDNPTQIPIGTPIALVFIAAALLFLPSILGMTGQTMFGEAGETAGPKGTVFK
ncbi:type IV secretion protein IcmD [uncultured Legionella sp.]|uniref:type IV secretion protein IcmD n=1 Tax=uncultured Legionella sp. TaxID=210934 RepID=UPI002622E671|nr:type IV secretion protein IcmD [uncultured Legionella sp.]